MLIVPKLIRSAAKRTNKNNKFAVFNINRQAMHDLRGRVSLRDIPDRDCNHGAFVSFNAPLPDGNVFWRPHTFTLQITDYS